jgi:glutamate 5-kinase
MEQRLIIKIGSSSLTSPEGELNEQRVYYFAEELVKLQNAGYQVMLVTSGSIAAGFRKIGYPSRPVHTHERQASAAVGQALLMQAYNAAFTQHGKTVAQILLTRSDFSDRQRIHNALNTIEELLNHHVIPIINENDTVAVNELKLKENNTFGDNDALSALVANLVKAQQLIIITDTDGLYTEDPHKNINAKRIDHVEQINEEIFRIAGGSGSSVGTGGMRSKIEAARIAVRGGVTTFIGRATHEDDIFLAVNGNGKGTYFETHLRSMPMKKQWVGFHSLPQGKVIVDLGAEQALVLRGKSLLPAGIAEVEGEFHPGDVIEVVNVQRQIIGRGVSNYSSKQLQAVAGLSTMEVKKRIEVQRIEVIHRDEWITLNQ